MISVPDLTVDRLRSIPLNRSRTAPAGIEGMRMKHLQTHLDGRGDVIEMWSLPWIDRGEEWIVPKHIYQSATDHGVIKAWHLHALHTDQFVITRGKMQVVCVDVREDSPTHGCVESWIVGVQRPALILIPPGVLHGWKALSAPETIVVNLQSEPYDPSDEIRFPWDTILTDIWEPNNG